MGQIHNDSNKELPTTELNERVSTLKPNKEYKVRQKYQWSYKCKVDFGYLIKFRNQTWQDYVNETAPHQ